MGKAFGVWHRVMVISVNYAQLGTSENDFVTTSPVEVDLTNEAHDFCLMDLIKCI